MAVWLLLIGAEELLVIKGIGTKPWVILLRNITHSYSWNVTPVRITPHSLSTCVCVSRFLFITSKDFLSEGNIFWVFRSRSGGLPHENDSPFWCRGDGKFFSKGSRQRSMTSSLVLKKKKKIWFYTVTLFHPGERRRPKFLFIIFVDFLIFSFSWLLSSLVLG